MAALALTAAVPSVAKASILSAAPTADGENQKLKPGVYYIVNDKRQKGTDLHVFVDGKGTLHGQHYSSPSTDFSDLFLLHAKGDRYTIQSLKNAKYVQSVGQNNEVYKTADDAYKFRIIYQTESSGTGKSYFNIYNSNAEEWCWHLDAQKDIVRWKPLMDNGIRAVGPSEFRFAPVTTLTNEQVLARLAQLTKVVDPTKDLTKYYQIVSDTYGRAMREDFIVGELSTSGFNSSDYSYYWKLERLANGRYVFQNAVTGKYIVPQNGQTSRSYTTAEGKGTGFDLQRNTDDPYVLAFEMVDANNVGIHCAESQGYHPVGWYTHNEANKWVFKEVTLDPAKLKEQQEAYKTRVDLTKNVDVYAEKVAKYFTNSAATEVTAATKAMTDEALKAQMTTEGVPQGLQEVVLKIKNQSWTVYPSGRNWEKLFRIADYKVYSENNYGAWART